MAITIQREKGVTVLIVDETFVSHEGEQEFDEKSREVLAEGVDLVLDVSQVPFIDSRRLATIVICYKRATEASLRMVVVGVSGAILETLRMSRLDTILDLVPTRREALTRLRQE